MQAFAYETIDEQVRACLSNRRVNELEVDELIKEACKALEGENVAIAYE